MIRIADIINVIEEFAPLPLQEDYDNSGLQVGDKNAITTGAMLCLDVTEAILDEAIDKKCNLVISHHPLLFKGLKSISGKTEIERIVMKAIKNDVTIYSTHTNMDSAWGGVSHFIASKLGLSNIEVLVPQESLLIKITTFVPQSHTSIVREAMFAAGAGRMGNYDNCSFNSTGDGTFRALEGATPFVGEIDATHNEREVRIEVIAQEWLQNNIISALVKAHPYEEPAFDIIKLSNKNKYSGLGVVGDITPENKATFLNKMKECFGVGCIKYSHSNTETISRVAICGGSGAPFIGDAIRSKADIYITGDLKYHDFTTNSQSIILADIGHYESEHCTKEIIYNIIQKKMPNFATYYPVTEKNPINYL